MGDSKYSFFDTLTPVTVPLQCPKAGTTYLFKWSDESQKEDWRADSYRWRQNGSFRCSKNAKCVDGQLMRCYFHVSDVQFYFDIVCRLSTMPGAENLTVTRNKQMFKL